VRRTVWSSIVLAVVLLFAACSLALVSTLSVSSAAVRGEGALSRHSEKGDAMVAASPPQGIDLDVTFISRVPLYKAYCVEYAWDISGQPGIPFLCPGTENDRRWPEPGEIVTFTAHIVNKGTLGSPESAYAWYIDAVEVARGTLPALAPANEVTTELQWPWPHGLSPDGQRALGEHTVRFTVDPDDAVAETYETNNSRQDRTNAMSFAIYLPAEAYHAYNVPVDPRWPWSAEDWLQKQVAAMNEAFAKSIYPVTPQGAPLRVRIDTIGIAATDPGPDGEHDGGWHIGGDVRCSDCGYYDPAIDVDWGLVHELSHQVSLIDLYAIGVYAPNVWVRDRNGWPANVGFGWPGGGIMFGGDTAPHSDPHLYSSHSAGGASTFAGYRNGYYGSYLFDIPMDNFLRVLDSQGHPAAEVEVALYQRTGPWDWTSHMCVDKSAEISGTTDAEGVFPLPNRSANGGTVTANGHVLHDNPFGVVDIIGNQDLFLVRLSRGDHEEFHWLDITQFNLAYWLGDVISHTFTIASHVPPPRAPLAPELLVPRVEGARATLEWHPSSSEGVVGYRVYRATPPMYQYVDASGLLTETRFEEEYQAAYDDGQHRVYAVTAVDASNRESAFSSFAYAPGIASPVAVAIARDGARVVLNNWNLYPLLRQQRDGRYTHRLVSPHFDMILSHSLAYDAWRRLWVSGLGESPVGRRALRAYTDEDMVPQVAFGEEGAAPGQFVSPAGVAAWSSGCTYGGPYAVDENTLLLLHFDGGYDGAQGEVGAADATEFVPGVSGQGVHIDASDWLTYPLKGNISLAAGTIEFWVRMDAEGDVGEIHDLFEFDGPGGGIQIVKHGAGNLHLVMRDATNLTDMHAEAGDWRAGDWHHVAVTWEKPRIALFVDGSLEAGSDAGTPPVCLAETLYVGSSPRSDWQADAVIDELRISDVPRYGAGTACQAILIADSGSHRLQAFDMQGNLISVYGGLGSGAGQFSAPQGLAVGGDGRVYVADQGNNRIVVLSFDGREFAYVGSLDAGLNSPTGVAVDTLSRIVVADTGNSRVVVLDASGNLLAEFTEPTDGYTGPFSAPCGVAVDPNGDIVVADTGNRRVVTVRGALSRHGLWLPLVVEGFQSRHSGHVSLLPGGSSGGAFSKVTREASASVHSSEGE